MKQGLFFENDELIYYKDGEPKHAGVVQIEGDIYYVSSKGRAVKGEHIVHGSMSNGILERGTYTFGEDYKLIKGSYIPPQKKKSKHKSNFKKKLQRIIHNKKIMTVTSALLILCLAAGLLIHGMENRADVMPSDGSVTDLANGMIVLPDFSEDVLLCTAAAKELYDNECTVKEAASSGDPYRPFQFNYHFENMDGVLVISEEQNLSDSKEYIMPATHSSVTIDNLKTDTTYYYQVNVGDKAYPGNFHTAKSTRFVYIPGVGNTRDIGGYGTLDGRTVKQGLLIRGRELDGLVEPTYYLPEEEVKGVQETFGFVYDLDLREHGVYQGTYVSRLGEDVEHASYQSPQYGLIFNQAYKQSLKQIFTDLANEENYPMYLHCIYGADRTGTIIYLLQGILNMSEEDMLREYQMTGFVGVDFADSQKMNPVINGLQPYEGNTLQEKIVTFLTTDIGVTEKEIEAIRDIFLE